MKVRSKQQCIGVINVGFMCLTTSAGMLCILARHLLDIAIGRSALTLPFMPGHLLLQFFL